MEQHKSDRSSFMEGSTPLRHSLAMPQGRRNRRVGLDDPPPTDILALHPRRIFSNTTEGLGISLMLILIRSISAASGGGCLVGWRVDERGVLSTTFHHDLKDPLTQLVFRSIPEVMPPIEFGSLSGVLGEQSNEMLLDRFTTPWRPRTSKRKRKFSYEDKEHIGCFVGTSSGHIYYINETGGCVEVLVGDGGILRLLYHSARDLLVAVIEGMILGQFLVDPDGAVTEVSKVKLSTRSPDAVISWAGPGLLAVSGGEASVRLWDLDAGDNYVLSLEDAANNETITSLAFSPSKSEIY
ncbi:unnamed protein product [Cyprideis torosa]|uniref:IFT140 first beta-propeller domain-containing protein n=1 Tax=Cyprideis torosa TaxID=163714 RepID=A0A7R8WTS7_9CRUS|nr:unnamed protein product [Cyprideis torosa]CAG0906154.1 unnamed protein product [Cyprideis torosa]